MLNEKKVSKTGGITIPAFMRRDMGIQSGEKIKIETDSNGDILIKRMIGSCVICASNENLSKIDDKFICKGCIDMIKNIKEGE